MAARGSFFHRHLQTVGLCLALLAPSSTKAQSGDTQNALAAQALYEQASADMDAKSYSSACLKLEEVTRLVPEGIGAKLTLGTCYEALGKLASAWSQYAIVSTMAARAGQTERALRASERAAALRPRLATLVIDVPREVRSLPGLSITRDRALVGDAQWGTPLPIDAGSHELMATAPGYKRWSGKVDIPADGITAGVRVPPLVPEPVGARATGDTMRAAPPPDRLWQRPLSYALITTGGVGVLGGALLGGLAIATNAESREPSRCDAQNICTPEGIGLQKEAGRLGTSSTVFIVAGGVVLAGGVALLLTAPRQAQQPSGGSADPVRARRTVALRLEIGPGEARIGGVF